MKANKNSASRLFYSIQYITLILNNTSVDEGVDVIDNSSYIETGVIFGLLDGVGSVDVF